NRAVRGERMRTISSPACGRGDERSETVRDLLSRSERQVRNDPRPPSPDALRAPTSPASGRGDGSLRSPRNSIALLQWFPVRVTFYSTEIAHVPLPGSHQQCARRRARAAARAARPLPEAEGGAPARGHRACVLGRATDRAGPD